jgi:hypothetical protein
MQGRKYRAENTRFSADRHTVVFSTDIAKAYPGEASVKTWIRTYTLKRHRSFAIADQYELSQTPEGVTSSNLMTYCKVTEVKPGLLQFQGDGFTLDMRYDAKVVKPKVEFIEVTDVKLKQYWPNGVSRVVLEFIQPALKQKHEAVFTLK